MASNTNPDQVAQMMQSWSEGLSSSIVSLVITTIIFTVITILFFYVGNFTEVAKNFGKYRCNPLLMPFAGQFGYDAKENFNFCITSIFNEKAVEVFSPLYALLSQFTNVFTIMMNATLGIRKLFSNFFLSVNTYISNVRNRIQNLLFQIRMSFIKLNSLMQRVYGTMFAVIYMGTSALTAANNTANNDLVKFLSEFCFDPETPIQLENGNFVPLQSVKIGDRLAILTNNVPVVTSIFEFDGQQTPMKKIDGVIVSSQHYVYYNTKWIIAADHPRAESVQSCKKLICLNVSGNVFKIGHSRLIVRDYDEHVSPSIIKEAQSIALSALNGIAFQTMDDYSLGFDSVLRVQMADNSWKSVSAVKVGESLKNCGRVMGCVQEQCAATVRIPGNQRVSAAQLLFLKDRWVRAGAVWPIEYETITLSQFITENCGTLILSNGIHTFYMRDYREVPLPEMESPYADEFTKSSHFPKSSQYNLA